MEENERIFKMSDYEHLRKSKDKGENIFLDKGENISFSEYLSEMQDELDSSKNYTNSETYENHESDRYEDDYSKEIFGELEKIGKMGDTECKNYLDDMLQNNFSRFSSLMEAQADFYILEENKLNNSENYDNPDLKNLIKEDLNTLSTTAYLSLMEDQLEGDR